MLDSEKQQALEDNIQQPTQLPSQATMTTKTPAPFLTYYTYQAQLMFGLPVSKEVNVAEHLLQ